MLPQEVQSRRDFRPQRVDMGTLKMQDMKMTDQITRRENARHENARPEIARPENNWPDSFLNIYDEEVFNTVLA